jgi:hypothetical protein
MGLRERHIGSIATRSGHDGSKVTVDAGALVRRLLLFEHCTLESDYLEEIPRLVTAFGFKGLMELLESEALSIICDYISMGNIGQTGGLRITQVRGGPLPLSSYRIVPVSVPDQLPTGEPGRDGFVDQALDVLRKMALPSGNRRRLMQAVAPKLDAYPRSVVNDSAAGFRELVGRQDASIRKALELEFRRARGMSLPDAVEVRLDDLGNDGDFRVATNLARRTGVGEAEAHKIIERALLGAAALEQRFVVMKATESVTGFRDDELSVLDGRLQWMWQSSDPAAQEDRFRRVAAIKGVPSLNDIPAGQRIDIKRVLKIRDSADCREMRQWLRDIESESDDEISERLFSFKEGLAAATHTRSKTTVRFLLVTGAGSIPGFGTVAGVVASGVDRFIFEKLIERPGPATFLGHSYPSIFKRAKKPHIVSRYTGRHVRQG